MKDASKGGGGGGDGGQWQWENAAAGATAGFATVAVMHPLDVVRTRFQVNDGRIANLPTYKNTPHALLTIARSEGLRGLYAGFYPAVLGSSVSWGLFFLFYSRAKLRYSHDEEEKLSPGLHLAAAAEAGALFTAYEELRKLLVDLKSKKTKRDGADEVLNSVDYTVLGASSKVAATLCTYPFQVIRARLQQRPNADGVPRYADTLHAVKETARFEGVRGFYKGITANLLKNVPASAVTFVVYENVLKLFKLTRTKDH